MREGTARNPYDFRNPVRTMGRLAGRDDEVAEIDELLRGSASGAPGHFALCGEPGMGKSSLLNGVIQIAKRRRLLAVKVDLREATVESLLTFYGTVFDTALKALADLGAIDQSHPVLQNWTRHTLLGDPELPEDPATYLAIGLAIAAKMSGKVVDDVPEAVLQRDVATLLQLGSTENIRGLVIAMDSAQMLGDNDDIPPSLMQLAQDTSKLTLVTASETLGPLQKMAPRSWAQIEVGAYSTASQILEAILKPLADAEELEFTATFRTANDIQELTQGRPYEVNLVSHFVWEAIAEGEQSDFALTEAVIREVLKELRDSGHEAGPTVGNIRNLSPDDIEQIARLTPFEGLTTRQLARGRLMFDDFDDDRLTEVELEIKAQLQRFATLGIVKLDHDRFQIAGGPEARLYLRYWAEQVADTKIEYDDTYVRLATGVCRRHVAQVLLGPDQLGKLMKGRWAHRDMSDAPAGKWLEATADVVREENVSALSDLLPDFDDAESLAEFSEQGGLLFGFALQVGLQNVEYADIAINVNSLTGEEAERQVREWIDVHAALLAKYEISVLKVRCEQLDPTFSRMAAAYSDLRRYCSLVFFLHEAGIIKPAVDAISDCIDRCEALIGSEPTDPLVRAKLADASNRLGFIQATAEDWNSAAQSLERSLELSLGDEWLPKFNLAYVEAERGHFEDASTLIAEAREAFTPSDGDIVLHAWLPVSSDWNSPVPRAAVVSVHGKWVSRFVELQALVYAAKADAQKITDLRDRLDGLSLSSSLPLLRLAGWAALTILDDRAKAVELFDRALHATELDGMDLVTAEYEFARGPLDFSDETLPSTAAER
ncbi:MAG: ATP-binding protein [Actinobacteria bacterium]|nr:ATP-binding protein [Actinomycetota bacterium]